MKRLISYLDIKIGLEIKRHIVTRVPFGKNAQKLEYAILKYLHLFHMPEETASNMINLRLRMTNPTKILNELKWTRRCSGTFTSDDDESQKESDKQN